MIQLLHDPTNGPAPRIGSHTTIPTDFRVRDNPGATITVHEDSA